MNGPIAPALGVHAVFVSDANLTRSLRVAGTGFLIANGIFITCWHCVRDGLSENERWAVAKKSTAVGDRFPYSALPLEEIAQHPGGRDLAIGRVPLRRDQGLSLYTGEVTLGLPLWTYGYPLPVRREDNIVLQPRYLEGYITRSFIWQDEEAMKRGGPQHVHEADMLIPEGLSGAPVFLRSGDNRPGLGNALVGVAFGTEESYTIVEWASVDSATGETRPEVRKIVPFGLIHTLDTIMELKGPATNGRSLGEIVQFPRDP